MARETVEMETLSWRAMSFIVAGLFISESLLSIVNSAITIDRIDKAKLKIVTEIPVALPVTFPVANF